MNHWNGNIVTSSYQTDMKFGDNFFKPFKTKYFFNRCGPLNTQEMQSENPVAIYGDFVNGMFDLATTNYDFQEIFTNLMNYCIA